jgi:glutamyl-tRNA reductase
MALHVFGISHNTAPLEVREKVAFPPERQGEALADLAGQPGVGEAVLVSTCNRTEVYCRAEDAGSVRGWLEREGAKSGVALAGTRKTRRCAMPSASRRGSTPWWWASRRSWAR